MAWITPKTNWVVTDPVNASDYNRIASNLLYLVILGNKIGYPITPQILGANKKISDLPYTSIWNAVENSLAEINDETFDFDIGDTKVFVINQPYINYEELNRLESAILKIYQQLIIQRDTVMHYPQTFGGSNIYKVPRVQYAREEVISYRIGFRLGDRKGVF